MVGGADNPTEFSCVADVEGAVVGMGFLDIVDGTGQPGGPGGTEAIIGYIVDHAHAGRGYATSMTRGLLTSAFEHLGLRRVVAGCFADNIGSVRVLQKAGLRREQHGIEDSWHAELGWIDGYTYALLASEWRSARREETELVAGGIGADGPGQFAPAGL